MRNFYLFISIIGTLVRHTYGYSQGFDTASIAHFRNKTIQLETDIEKIEYNDSLQKAIIQFINVPDNFHVSLNHIPYIGDLLSPDNTFRMITWNISLSDGTYDYFCYIQLNPKNPIEPKWFELIDKHKTIQRPHYKQLKKNSWYGCLYYRIIPFKHKGKVLYILLGWEGNNNYSNKKVIDCMGFNNRDELFFGKTVFEGTKHPRRRVVFEYNKEAYLLLRYIDEKKQIVFNRLEPMKPELKGLYSFYIPTLTYDAYQLKKGKWILVKDVKPRNDKSNRIYIDPKKRPKPPNKP